MSSDPSPRSTPTPLSIFHLINRGIVVATVYASTILTAILLMRLFRPGAPGVLVAAVTGLVAGAIAGFSNTQTNEDAGRDLKRNAADALVVIVWTGLILWGIFLLKHFTFIRYLLPYFGFFAAGTLIGGLAGEPIVRWVGRFSIKGRRPFNFVNHVTEGIGNHDVRFVTRVVIQSILFAALVALMVTVVYVVLILLAIALGLYLVAKLLGWDDKGGKTYIPKGYKVRQDGRVVKERLLFDDETGVRLVRDGLGRSKIIKEGVLFDKDTGLRIDGEGRTTKEGILFSDDKDAHITRKGQVLESDPKDRRKSD